MEVRSQGAASPGVDDRGRESMRRVDEANDRILELTRSYKERIAINLRPRRKEDDEGKLISYHSSSRRSWFGASTA